MQESQTLLDKAHTENQQVSQQVTHHEKLRFAAEEAKVGLEKQLVETKDTAQQQFNLLKEQQLKNEQLLQAQISDLKNYQKIQTDKISALENTVIQKKQAHEQACVLLHNQLEAQRKQLQAAEVSLYTAQQAQTQLLRQNQQLTEKRHQLKEQFSVITQQYQEQTLVLACRDAEITFLKEQLADARERIASQAKDLQGQLKQLEKLATHQEKVSLVTWREANNPPEQI